MKNIKDKLVLITGAANGIGRLMALDFAGRGGRVLAWDINAAGLEALQKEAEEKGLFIKGAVCDVSRHDDIRRRAAEVQSQYGPPDMLINNAGVVSGGKILDLSDEQIECTMNINVLALFRTVRAFLPAMLKRGSGHIVTIASAAGLIGVSALTDYCASKFAAFGFNESLRMELRRYGRGIKTTVVCPFFIDTGMFAGVKTRIPHLLPILKQEYAAGRIVKAVLKNRPVIIMPRFAYTTILLKLFSPAFIDFCADVFGINHSMDEFRGRV